MLQDASIATDSISTQDHIGKPQWQAMLNYVAELHARSTHPVRAPFLYPWEEIGPGYGYGPAFGHWDIVHQILDHLPDNPEHARQQILNNLQCQQNDGFLPGSLWLKGGKVRWGQHEGHPPVWPVAVDEWSRVTGSSELIERCYEPLVRQIGWFQSHRAASPQGFFYTDILNGLWESGVDEGVRFDTAQPGAYTCIDATSHVYWLYEHAARWAKRLNQESSHFEQAAHALRDFVRSELFDPETGWFYDIWMMRDPAQKRLALEGMWPLVCGIATPEQAGRIVANLMDAQKFNCPHPPCTVAMGEPGFELRMWRGPTWNSMTFWAARGCLAYGYDEAACHLLEAALDASAHQFEATGTIWEFYHPFLGDPQELKRKPHTQYNAPFPDYLGHNPLRAMARLWAENRDRE